MTVIAKFSRRVKHAKSGPKVRNTVTFFPCGSLRSPHATTQHRDHARNSLEAEAEAASAAAADGEVEFAGERTREQRDAELRAHAIEVDA